MDKLPNKVAIYSDAENSFREAFERLKNGTPIVLPKGSKVSQNNIGKEAGCDPRALRKDRFPLLVLEIQTWVAAHRRNAPKSPRQRILSQRARNNELTESIKKLTDQRDQATSLLAEADRMILDLTIEITHLKSLLPETNVVKLRGGGG